MYKSAEITDKQIPHYSHLKQSVKPKSMFKREYMLNQSFFDPTQSSPPNHFMINLYMRNQMYNLHHKNEDNLVMQ
jgi:hypothetical protein